MEMNSKGLCVMSSISPEIALPFKANAGNRCHLILR